MDPRSLLGLRDGADRSDVEAARRRLHRLLATHGAGAGELRRLVDAAADAVLSHRTADLSVDPHAVLGLRPGATPTDVRAAYRRLAAVVHPDRGGTDELFRAVVAAHDVLTGREPPRRHRRPRASERWSPPAPKPPYRAPAPEARPQPPRWRSWRDLAQHGATILAIVGAAVSAWALQPVAGAATVAIALVGARTVLRAAVEGVLRNVVVLLGSRVRVAAAVDPERFLEEACLEAPVGRSSQDDLYRAYARWCKGRGEPVAPWVFVERLRALGLLFIRSSAWEHGLWIGIVLRR